MVVLLFVLALMSSAYFVCTPNAQWKRKKNERKSTRSQQFACTHTHNTHVVCCRKWEEKLNVFLLPPRQIQFIVRPNNEALNKKKLNAISFLRLLFVYIMCIETFMSEQQRRHIVVVVLFSSFSGRCWRQCWCPWWLLLFTCRLHLTMLMLSATT